VQSHADLALSDPDKDPAACRRALEVVSAESRHLSRVVAGLLTLARADAGHLSTTLEPVDLAELCAETVRRLRPLAETRTLAFEGPAELLVQGDPDWLRQLLLNLAENAIQHTSSSGTVHVSATRQGSRAQIEVRDNGCGIPPEDLPHIFDRFYRVDKARARPRRRGTGVVHRSMDRRAA
jgi:signal transduction histidine kinase